MRKTTTFLLVFLFALSTSKAQEWGLFKGDTVHYLKQELYNFGVNNQSNTFGLSVLIDTVLNKNSSVKTIFTKDYSDSENLGYFHNNCTALSASLFGDSVVVISDTSIFYINSAQIQWLHNSNSWVFFSDTSNNQLLIFLDSTVATGSDSIRYYSFTVNAAVNHDLHQFDSAQIILSKNTGMLEGFDFSVFPDTLEKIELLKKGPITYRDIYNYEVGDEFHVSVKSDNFFGTYAYNIKYEITDKILHSNDSVAYKINGNWVGYNLSTLVGSGAFLDTHKSSLYLDSIGLFDDGYQLHTYVSIGESFNPIYSIYKDTLCNNSFENIAYREYVFGIGMFYHSMEADAMTSPTVQTYDENLVYYKKGTKTWGIPIFPVGIEELQGNRLQFFPNPVKDDLIIEGLICSWKYEIVNTAGKRVKEGDVSATENKIALEQLQSGIYILVIRTENRLRTHKIIIN